MNEIRYREWHKDASIGEIELWIMKRMEEGWELASHSHSPYGMSVFMKRDKLNENKTN